MHKGLLALISLFLCPSTGAAQPPTLESNSIRTLSVAFARSWTPLQGTEERSSGRLYYQAPGPVLVQVELPVRQILQLDGAHLRIFYPAQGQAFDILMTDGQTLPFFQAYLQSVTENFGQVMLGYRLVGHESRHDTLVTSWAAPKKDGKSLGTATMAQRSGRLQWLALFDAKGARVVLYSCGDYDSTSGLALPGKVSVDVDRGTSRGREVVSYWDSVVNKDLPEWVTSFQLPVDAVVKDLR